VGCGTAPLIPDLVLVVGRSASGTQQAKVEEIVPTDLFDLTAIADRLTHYDACLFCLGVSAAGMKERDYERVAYDLTLWVVSTLAGLNPAMTFVYVSGADTDSTERGRLMWARLKGRTENALLRMPFKAAYMSRPGYIQPLHGIRAKTGWYNALYAIMAPPYPLWKALFPNAVTTTEQLGRAMIPMAKQGNPKPVLESRDINSISTSSASAGHG
jgi:hypothetical protein